MKSFLLFKSNEPRSPPRSAGFRETDAATKLRIPKLGRARSKVARGARRRGGTLVTREKWGVKGGRLTIEAAGRPLSTSDIRKGSRLPGRRPGEPLKRCDDGKGI